MERRLGKWKKYNENKRQEERKYGGEEGREKLRGEK